MTVPPSEELESAVSAIVEGADAEAELAASRAQMAEGLAQMAGVLAAYWQALGGLLPKKLAEEAWLDYAGQLHNRCLYGGPQ